MPRTRRVRYRSATETLPDKIPHDLRLRRTTGVSGTRRNPGREDGVTWSNGDTFISPADVDGYPDEAIWDEQLDVLDEIIRDLPNGEETAREPIMIELEEIAKTKGVSKQFEVAYPPRRVIVVDDEEWEMPDGCSVDDDWESVPAAEEEECEKRQTYSEVLRGYFDDR